MSKSRQRHLQSRKECRKQRRIGKTITRHHCMKAKKFGGTYEPKNIMLLTWEKHQMLHKIFGLRSIPQIIELLLAWCHYRYILHGEHDKEVIYLHYKKEYDHFLERFSKQDRLD